LLALIPMIPVFMNMKEPNGRVQRRPPRCGGERRPQRYVGPVYFSVQVTTDFHSGIPVFRGRIPMSRNQYPLTGIPETPGIKSTTSPAAPSQDS
jgi:hypothetical protein